ncbi:mechanosensitive ion channel family protein [Anianabacter salinae]|uniref:mechanosensitive ion channel family protein n=1 Tax=Anianabacter salinae TaxID=2851023 RepID=UPI00225E0176|nr:mechanosensitive ion channel domain-containing protein [Anianabacter salinae]MBV0913693.1 mechanosensitive ion channel [Anianabacter salinae]
MDGEIQAILAQLVALAGMIESQARNLLLPSRLVQLAILVGCLVAAYLLKMAISPRYREWLRTREGWQMWRLRAALTFDRRLLLIFFVALSWIATWTMQAIHAFPSRSYLLELVATIALALLLVVFATRLVRNPALRSVVRWGLWAYVIVYYTGLVDEMTAILDGLAVEFGEFRLSALTLLKAAVVTGLLFTLARIVSTTTSARIRSNEAISPSMQVLMVKMLQIGLYAAAFFIGLKAVGFDLTGLAVLSGAIGVGLGFGLQKVVSNLVSGVILLLDRSIKPGDVISLGETFGWINALGARYVSITTRDGKEYLIPNEDLITGQVVNWSHSNDFVRLDIFFGTAYGDDPHLVRKVAVEAASSVNRVLTDRPAVCHIVGFGDSSVDYILRFWIRDPTQGLTNIRGNVYLALWDAFREHGISIPFPQREVKMLEGSQLATGAPPD